MILKRLFTLLITVSILCVFTVACSSKVAQLEINSISLPDNETLKYVVKSSDGTQQLGNATVTIAKKDNAYVLSSSEFVGKTKDDITFVASADTLKPISETRVLDIPAGLTIPQGIWQINATVANGKMVVEANTPQGHQGPSSVGVPSDAYGNDEALFLLFRALPFADGYTARFTNIILWPNVQMPKCTVSVVGKEDVQIGNTRINTWKLELSTGNSKQYVWYATTSLHQLIKYDNGSSMLLLQPDVAVAVTK